LVSAGMCRVICQTRSGSHLITSIFSTWVLPKLLLARAYASLRRQIFRIAKPMTALKLGMMTTLPILMISMHR
jgi:hypothetical protein